MLSLTFSDFPILRQILRPHQRDGILFLWSVITGQAKNIGEGYASRHGAILADEMGKCLNARVEQAGYISSAQSADSMRTHRFGKDFDLNCAIVAVTEAIPSYRSHCGCDSGETYSSCCNPTKKYKPLMCP